MVHGFQSLTDNHSPAEETVYGAFLTSFIFEAFYLVTKLQMVHDELSGITSVQRTLSVDGSIKSERQQKKNNSDGCWIEPMLLITHSTPQNLTSNELSGDEKETILQKTAGKWFFHPSLHWQNLLDGEHGIILPKDVVRGGGRQGQRESKEDRKCCKQSICHQRC